MALKLNELKVSSFVTSNNQTKTVIGGEEENPNFPSTYNLRVCSIPSKYEPCTIDTVDSPDCTLEC